MDANGTRFHLLLGRDDWGRCTSAGVALARAWDASPPFETSAAVAWDKESATLTLAPLTPRFVAAQGDVPLSLDARRGAAGDAFGNLYWIDESRQAIRVLSVGSGRAARFWPDDAPLSCGDNGGFVPLAPQIPTTVRLAGLAVTDDHYLVVGTLAPAGLLVFDLHAVGEPVVLRWPTAFAPYDIAPRAGGGMFVLDRANRRYWTLDRRFAIVPTGGEITLEDEYSDDFQPLAGGSRAVAARRVAQGVEFDLASPPLLGDVIAIEALGDDAVLLLERGSATASARVAAYRAGTPLGDAISLGLVADELEEDARAGFSLIGHDMALIRDAQAANRATLFVVAAEGNQSFAFTAEAGATELTLRVSRAYYPMRRFGGKGLAGGGSGLFCDFAATWIPLVAQRLARYAREARIETPAFDSTLPDCVWHRLLLDACIPPGCDVLIESRASNARDFLATTPWQAEPRLYRRGDGAELPWLQAPFADAAAGTWEILFQRARGQYLQLRLTLSGNERATPQVARLRAWYPRFSYLERYLPAVYRNDEASASFLDRYLANLEGIDTAIEDRIAAAQLLLDVRSAPADALAWLASWFGVALDPAWDERRRRLFIRHAMTFFQWRGTVHGLRMALALALDPCIDEAMLDEPARQPKRPHDIRIIERFLTRRFSLLALGDPNELATPRTVSPAPRWTPQEGGERLSQRYADAVGKPGAVYAPVPPADAAEARAWRDFSQTTLGFIPEAASAERALWQQYLASRHGSAIADSSDLEVPRDLPDAGTRRDDWRTFLARTPVRDLSLLTLWQAFLARRYRRIRAMNVRYGTRWERFEEVSFPDRLPADGAPLVDWDTFESTVLAMHRKAHRFLVLIPAPRARPERAKARARLDIARRIVALEKPAHTVFNVDLYWALFRVGEARVEIDTVLEAGSRAPDLLPPVVLGSNYVGEAHLDRTLPAGRTVLGCA